MDQPPLEFQYTLTPAEQHEAHRRMVFFALGKDSGIIASCLLLALTVGVPLVGAALWLSSRPEEREIPIPAFIYIPFIIPLIWTNLRALRRPTRPLVPVTQTIALRLDQGFVHFGPETITIARPWNDFVGYEETPELFLLITLDGFITIPKRTLPQCFLNDFRMFIGGLTLKQGPTLAFPVLLQPDSHDRPR